MSLDRATHSVRLLQTDRASEDRLRDKLHMRRNKLTDDLNLI